MMLKTKTALRDEIETITAKHWHKLLIADEWLTGVAVELFIEKVSQPKNIKRKQQKIVIADDGYCWLQIIPSDKHWWLTAIFDNNNKLVECYFDITYHSDPVSLSFVDLFLDVVYTSDKKIILLDQNELEAALKDGSIDRNIYDIALDAANDLISDLNKTDDFIHRIWQYHSLFSEVGNGK